MIEDALREHAGSEFLTSLGIDALTALFLIGAEVFSAGTATGFLIAATAVGGYGVSRKLEQATELGLAAATGTSESAMPVTTERVDEAKVAAIIQAGATLLALAGPALRVGAKAKEAAEVGAAARELAAARKIAEADALTLVRAARRLSPEDQAFVEAATARVRGGTALSAAEATRLAEITNELGTEGQLVFSSVNDLEKIWGSERYWGQTEGAVYGARVPANTLLRRLQAGIAGEGKDGLVIFQGEAADLFHAHEVEGPYSALKRLLGQQKAGFGDIVLEDAVKEGDTIIVTRARLVPTHAGQSETHAVARLGVRRLLIEPLAAAGVVSGGVLVYAGYKWVTEEPTPPATPGVSPVPQVEAGTDAGVSR